MKKVLTPVIIGFIIFIIGIICFSFEVKAFNSNPFASSFKMEQEVLEYKIDEEDVYRITNSGIDTNVNLYIDNNLSNKIRIVVSHPVMTKIDYRYLDIDEEEEFISIDFDSSLELDFEHLKTLLSMGINGIKDQIKYDYSLLEYPTIKVFVNEKYKDNIEFVGKYGKVYNQIR